MLRRFASAGAALALAFAAPPARAQACESAVSTCVDSDTLWSAAGAARFVGVGGVDTVAPRRVGFGLATSVQSRPLVLLSPSPPPAGTETAAIDAQVTTTFLFAWGLVRDFQLDAALPVTLGQSGASTSAISGGRALQDTAMRDLRFGFTWAALPRVEGKALALAVRSQFVAPTGDEGQLAGERGVVWNPTVAAELEAGRFFGGAELGARVRPTAELAGARIGTQAQIGVGLGFDVLASVRPRLLSLMVEARALPALVEQRIPVATALGLSSVPGGSAFVPAEWMASVRAAPFLDGDLGIQLGGGAGLPIVDGSASATAPRFRLFLGLRYAPSGKNGGGR